MTSQGEQACENFTDEVVYPLLATLPIHDLDNNRDLGALPLKQANYLLDASKTAAREHCFFAIRQVLCQSTVTQTHTSADIFYYEH